jgi:type IV secretory pathway TrbL component
MIFNKVYDYYIMSTTTTLTENEMNNDNITEDVPILEENPNPELQMPSFEFKNIIIFILVILLAFSLIGVNLIEFMSNITLVIYSDH